MTRCMSMKHAHKMDRACMHVMTMRSQFVR